MSAAADVGQCLFTKHAQGFGASVSWGVLVWASFGHRLHRCEQVLHSLYRLKLDASPSKCCIRFIVSRSPGATNAMP